MASVTSTVTRRAAAARAWQAYADGECGSIAAASRTYGVPETSIRRWRDELEKQAATG